MADMPPLGSLILRVMRAGSILAAGFVVLVMVMEFAKRALSDGIGGMSRPDFVFMGVLIAMLIGFLWLARAITREMKKHGPSG